MGKDVILEKILEKMKNLTPEQKEMMEKITDSMSEEIKELVDSFKKDKFISEEIIEARKVYKKLNNDDATIFTHLCAVDLLNRGGSNMTCSNISSNLGHTDKIFIMRGDEMVDTFIDFVESSQESWVDRLKKITAEREKDVERKLS